MPEKNKKESLLKELEDVKGLMNHLETEYGKASVSEKYYQELKGKYLEKIEDLENKLGSNKDEKISGAMAKQKKKTEKKKTEPEEDEEPEEESSEESSEAPKEEAEAPEENSDESAPVKEEKKKGGFLGRLLKRKEKSKEEKPVEEPNEEKPQKTEKKDEKTDEIEVGEVEEMTPEVIEKLAMQAAKAGGVSGSQAETVEQPVEEEVSAGQMETPKDIEIEKLKVMIESIRETGHGTEETIRTLSESIGEIRSMVFQTDGSLKETSLKLENIGDEISEVKPKEIDKKFRDVNATLEKYQLLMEKFDRKSEDLGVKINKVYEMLKAIGGIENMIDLNKTTQKQIEDIKEAMKYTERLAFKTEKVFIDLNKDLENFTFYKTKQDDLEESVRDLLKSIDGLNSKMESFSTRRDLEMIKADILVVQKQMEEINKVLPTFQAKLPEPIVNLRKEKDDILVFLDSLEEQSKTGTISIGESEDVKKKNLKKLSIIEKKLGEEWKKIEDMVAKGIIPKEEEPKEEVKVQELPTNEKEKTEKKKDESEETEEKKPPEEPSEAPVEQEEAPKEEAEAPEEKKKKLKEKKVEIETKPVENIESAKEEKVPENVEIKTKEVKHEEIIKEEDTEKTKEMQSEERNKREEMVNVIKKIRDKMK